MATFQVPVWFNVEADDADHALEMVEDAIETAIEVLDDESALALSEFAAGDIEDVIEVTENDY